ncbi:hypothetical protein A1F97_02038 [Pyrenophora tritici-repentis]|uniref:Uncharacterized protein n=2 Tax=Pyrenophora tritici-repentis TaxID=45151 RepID=A0A2W1D975_9PLEO|nr:uncharacterized protein PTRG_10703 [Pyrenophora tritici-repentis Pt-1C-BFP]KAI1516432.1 hypothetical protein Ptr86124_004969 [Pyrenophora tritici-repentis]EDU43753.1 predicted protein [Pyrenophora tritici-repentis Pt-1C-BFP]KAI1671351.1 hypothetical protein L13192_04708 [Pyrenophora tritici-repentis]KAI1685166.1 hypothetical protein KJE20_05450 [Pyrenophora tritici-repentis]PZC93400.1 hypothetical protein A1F95_07301 [Pyrenophora tritici-repentis]
MIRDPHFWKRFSVAVHKDDLAKEELAKQDGKNAYVITSTLPFCEPTPLGTPIAQTPMATSHLPQSQSPQMSQTTRLRPISPIRPFSLVFSSDPITTTTTSTQEKAPPSTPSSKQQKRRSKLHKSPSTKPLLRPEIFAPIPPPTRTISIKTEHTAITSRPGTQRSNATPSIAPAPFSSRPGTRRSNLAPSIRTTQQYTTSPPISPARSFFRTGNISALSLSLSGRPNSRFNFVTTISADVENSDTWLARQKKKERHRAWLCWAFWGVLALLIVSAVVTVVVLKAHGIVKF